LTLLLLALLLVTLGPVFAQDKVTLVTGKTRVGDIVVVDDGDVVLVTRDGRVTTIARDQVAEIRRGTPLKKATLERLESVNLRDPKAFFAVAKWAYESRAFRKDGQRLLRRVLAFDPDHTEARTMLGHVYALDTWYPDSRAAFIAVKDRMKADGFAYHKKGWIKKELLPFLKEAPGDWVLWQNFCWRSLSDVRKERGDRLWKKEWYVGPEAKLVRTLKEIENLTGDDCHAALRGTSRVYCFLGRNEAVAAAERQEKARAWFVKEFEVAKRRKALVKYPGKIDWVLSGEEAFKRYLDKRGRAGKSKAGYELSLQTGNTASGFNYVGHLGKEAWQYSLVSHMGMAMMHAFWARKSEPAPAWLGVAAAHHSEIAVFGDVRVQWVHVKAYDQTVKIPSLDGRNMKEIKQMVRDLYKGIPLPPLRSMMSKDMNELTPELDALGTVYLLFFLQEHKETFLEFLTKPCPNEQNVRERFEHHFKMTYEDMDRKFVEWLRH